MNRLTPLCAILSCSVMLTISGCGGGGGGGNDQPPTTAVVKISTATTVPLAGASVRLPIPYGVSVPTSGGQVANGVITTSGVLAGTLGGQARGTLVPGFTSYSAPTPTQKGALKFTFVAYSTSFRSGEFATVTCSFSGTPPIKSAFDTLLLQATDTGGSPVASPGESFSLTIQ